MNVLLAVLLIGFGLTLIDQRTHKLHLLAGVIFILAGALFAL